MRRKIQVSIYLLNVFVGFERVSTYLYLASVPLAIFFFEDFKDYSFTQRRKYSRVFIYSNMPSAKYSRVFIYSNMPSAKYSRVFIYSNFEISEYSPVSIYSKIIVTKYSLPIHFEYFFE